MSKDSKGVVFDLPNEFSTIVKACVSVSVCVGGGGRVGAGGGGREGGREDLSIGFSTIVKACVPVSVCVCAWGGGEGGDLSIGFSNHCQGMCACECVCGGWGSVW